MANKRQSFNPTDLNSESLIPDAEPQAAQAASHGRIYTGVQQINSDAFKLTNALMKKNHAMDGSDPLWVDHDHTHFYRSFDSHGAELKHSPPVGGHFHEVRITGVDTNGRPMAEVGPPLKWVTARQGRRTVRVAVEVPEDRHTHHAVYLRTDLIKVQQINPEFVRFQAEIESRKPGPVEGVR